MKILAEDWDFIRENDVPMEEVKPCFVYEYSREFDWVKQAMSESPNKPEGVSVFHASEREGGGSVITSTIESVGKGLCLQVPKGFPNKSYLNSSRSTCEMWWVEARTISQQILDVNQSERPVLHEVPDNHVSSGEDMARRTVRLSINFGMPDGELERAFREYVKETRSKFELSVKRGPKKNQIQVTDAGSRDPFAALKSLVAWRLTRACGGSTAAHNFAVKMKIPVSREPKNLWRDAETAAQIFKEVFKANMPAS